MVKEYILPDGRVLELSRIEKADGLISFEELIRKKLLPTAEPVGWTLQPVNNKVVWLYDAGKTKPYRYADLPEKIKKRNAENKRKYRERCTCDQCRVRQKSVKAIIHTDIDGKPMKLCSDCYNFLKK